MTFRTSMIATVAAFAVGLGATSPALAKDTISATHAFPATLIYSKSFLEFVEKANKAGEGVLKSKFVAAPKPSR